MANEEQLAILKQGVDVWNKWREENPTLQIDLSEAQFLHAQLTGVNFSRANLAGAYFFVTDLTEADFDDAILGTLFDGDKSRYYPGVHFEGCNLHRARISNTHLADVVFHGADLCDANFSNADLITTIFRTSLLSRTKFSSSRLGHTIFEDIDLSKAMGLDEVHHILPSRIGTDTFVQSIGKIPETFLRGCGLSDWEIEMVKLYNPDLSNDEITQIQYEVFELRATQALQISPLFISYSHGDGVFVDKLEEHLNKKGVRFWRDIHDLKAGRIEKQIDRAISQNRTVLLVLSDHSLKSDWVEHEVRTARGLEKETNRDVLCPVALDDSWKKSHWPERLMEQVTEYNILDFSAWKDDDKFDEMFRRLIDGLDLFYKA